MLLLASIALASPLWSGWIMDSLAQAMASRWSECTLQRVEYDGLRYLTPDSLEQAAKFPYGTSLFELDYPLLQQRLLNLPWVKDARVLRRLPDQLEVRIIEHEPLATIRSNRIFALTAEGIVLPVPAAEWVWNLPLLTPPQALTLSPGGQIKDQSTLELLRQVVDVREAAPAIWSNLSELYFHSKEIRATLLDPPVILRMQRVNEHRTWLALQELLDKEFDQDDQHNKVMTIDLRIPGNIILQSPEIAQLAQETPNP